MFLRTQRLLALCLVTLPWAQPAPAEIFPARAGEYTRGPVTSVTPPDADLYDEFGFVEAEQTNYSGPAGSFRITGWRVKDSTGALALYQLRRPANAKPSNLAPLAADVPGGVITAYGNFVLEYAGFSPNKTQLDELLVGLKQVERSPLPTLIQFLPPENLVPNSERYILGPVSLERFAPEIRPSLAAFHLSTEGEQGRYRTNSGELTMTIFSYPVPNMAREQQAAFLEVPGVLAKRSGSLVAVIYPPGAGGDTWRDDAERVLAKVDYEFDVTRQKVGVPPVQGMANLVLTAFLLVGVLFAASLLAGIWLGGFRTVLRRFGWAKEPGEMTVLRIPASTSKTDPPK